VLRAHNVKYVFTLVGGHISPILVACEKLGIRIVDTRHEATAVFAADAVARLSGKHSITYVNATPINELHLEMWCFRPVFSILSFFYSFIQPVWVF
jgi:hypothetical protein